MVGVGIVMALLALLVVWPYRIHGPSMLPAYNSGDLVLVEKLSYRFRNPKAGEVVVFNSPRGEQLIKRVTSEVQPLQGVEPLYWLEGDNKDQSTDSRQFGPVVKKAIVGRVMWRVLTWPSF